MLSDTGALFQDIRMIQTGKAVSVIVPTRNEAGNVERLLTLLKNAFCETIIEVIFVDDSTDETPQVVKAAANQFPSLHVQLIHRLPDQRKDGLGGAVLVGLKAARTEYICVMDGDLQHPPELVPILLNAAVENQQDIVIATRRNTASQMDGLNYVRNLFYRGLDLIARIFFPRHLRGVSDPLTGFFLVRKEAINLDALQPDGFKILMEILVRNPNLRKGEIPFHFGQRFAGESKASVAEVLKFIRLLWGMRFGYGSLRFIGFAIVGGSGIAVNSIVLVLATELLNFHYLISVVIASIASSVWNFGFTEGFVYHSNRQAQGRPKRLGMFLSMNMIALALRSPVVYVLTTLFGVYYVVSNLISLVILTILRFLVADNFIWQQESTKSLQTKQDY
jgi:dolichol-phosphate mannosyltransferase